MPSRREFLGAAALAAARPLGAASAYKMAVIGLVHSHVWGHLGPMQPPSGDRASLRAEKDPCDF
jgi:hypothetical protein